MAVLVAAIGLVLQVLVALPGRSEGLISPLTTAQSVPEMQEILAVEGHSTQLPCDISPPAPHEQVYLVLWYRKDEGEPIYSYDARSGSSDQGRRWSDDANGFGNRAYFQVKMLPAQLNIEQVRRHEAGVYRCRVDFKTAPTRNTLMNLTVIVPPSNPTIFDESGQEAHHVVGPYMVGETVVLKCITSGGEPLPHVTWWRDSHLLDSSYETTFARTIQNTLTIPRLSRSDLGAQLTCQASNNNISMPVSHRVTIDMKFRPMTVSITTRKEPLSAGKVYTLECRTAGSRPSATVTWWKRNKFVGRTDQKVIDNGNVTVSTFRYVPMAHDHGKNITCRAENTEIPGAVLEDNWRLTIYHAPVVMMSLGASLDANDIAEGNDIYFDCKVTANPDAYKIVWLHNDVMVGHSIHDGIIISGSSLVLQKVSRKQAGIYSCVASNIEGDTQSNPIQLKIKYKPICGHFKRVIQGVGRGRASHILCPVLAHPPPTAFSWAFNNSQQTVELNSSEYRSNGTLSVLRYQPEDDEDFGLIYCRASNAMGRMAEPCVFKIIPAGPPDPPSNCSVVNQTTDSLVVECLPGFDGGLSQHFQLEVTDLQTGKLLANATDENPEFEVSGLNSGRGLKITIFAVNSDGRSKSAVLEGFTLKVAELQVESPVPLEFTPVLGVLVGVVFTLMLVAFVVILVLRVKYRNPQPKRYNSAHNQSALPTEQDQRDYLGDSRADLHEEALKVTRDTSQAGQQSQQQQHLTVNVMSTMSRLSPAGLGSSGAGSTTESQYSGSNGGGSATSYTTAELEEQRTPPYMPTNRHRIANARNPSPVESSGSDGPYARLQPSRAPVVGNCSSGVTQPLLSGSDPIYSQIDPSQKRRARLAASAAGSSSLPCHVIENPTPQSVSDGATPPPAGGDVPQQEVKNWVPLLMSKHQQESTL